MDYKSKYYKANGSTLLRHDALLRIVKLSLACLVTIPFIICWAGYYYAYMLYKMDMQISAVLVLLYYILFISMGRIYDCFYISIHKKDEMVLSSCLTVFMVNIMIYIVFILMAQGFPNIFPLVMLSFAQFILVVIWVFLAQRWYYKKFPPRKTVIIHTCEQGLADLIKHYQLDKKFQVIKDYSIDECLADEMTSLSIADTVFMQDIPSTKRDLIMKHCLKMGIKVYILPTIGDVILSSAVKQHLLHLPVLTITRYSPSPVFLFVKRLFDIVLSLVGIIVFSPLMVLTALAIKFEDGGEILFRQTRLTKNGREFEILKFRSMCVDAEKDGVARLSSGVDDHRVTKVGHFIRKVRFDELPQLFNIFKGDMTIVGPRPERPELALEIEKSVPEFPLRLQAKAGLTGYAQVYGKYNTTPYYKLQMDLMYLSEPSLFKDLCLIFATIKILFMKDSTEGVESLEQEVS